MGELNLRLTLNTNGSITANWSPAANTTKYTALMRVVGASQAVYNNMNLYTTYCNSRANLEANQQYEVTVTAIRSSGGTLSDMARILIPSDFYDNQPIAVPQNVRAVADTSSVTVSFDAVDHARSYDILFDNRVTNVTTTSMRFTGLQQQTSHTYAVRAKTTKQTSAYSATRTIRTLAASQPDPTLVTPAVPSGIQKEGTDTKVTIRWNGVSGATGYDIQFDGRVYGVTSPEREFTGLTAGKSYTFRIRSKKGTAVSAYTAANTVTTAPKAPMTISATSTDTTITIEWGQVTGATGYVVRCNGSDRIISSSAQRSCTVEGLKPNTSYTYQICSIGVEGFRSSFSVSKTIKTKLAAPAVPTGITKSATENTVSIGWNAVNDAKSYEVLFNGTVHTTTFTSITLTRLTAGTAYTFQIRAKNAEAAGAYTAVYTVTTTPAAPATINAESTDTTVTVTWSPAKGAVGYIVRFNNQDVHLSGSVTSYTVSGLKAKTTYSYQICSKGADAVGSYSTSRTIKTQALAVPTGITHQATENSVTISWNAVSGATKYYVSFNNLTYSPNETTITFRSLPANHSYTYQIKAANSTESGAYSAVRTVTTVPLAPAASGVSGVTSENSATLSWSAVAGAESYDVLFNGTVHNVKTNSAAITGLAADTNYRYQIRVRNRDGVSAYNTAKTIRTAPGVPAATATSSANRAHVRWSAVPGAASYDVIFHGTTYRVTATSRTISGLTAGAVYTYQVRSNGANGSSSYSPVKNVMIVPDVPVVIGATAETYALAISWKEAAGASGYEVLMKDKTYATTATSVKITGLSASTEYTYQVRAKNAGGYSEYTNKCKAGTLVKPPATPVITSPSVTWCSVTLRWNYVTGATGYDVLFNGTVYEVSNNNTSITLDNLSESTRYSYQVRAKNAGGASAYSAAATVTTLAKPFAAPTGITAVATINSVTISWSAVNKATGYEIVFNETTYSQTGTSRTFSGLAAGTEYKYQIRAKNAAVVSPYSTERTVTTISATPENVTATVTATTMTISWDAVKGAVDYVVNHNGRYSVRTGTTAEYTGLTPDTEYVYQVRARNQSGVGAFSALKTVRTLSGVPDVPDTVWAEPDFNSIVVKWLKVEDALEYEVEFDGVAAAAVPAGQERAVFAVRSSEDQEMSRLFDGLQPNTNHTFRVRAGNAYGFGEYSSLQTTATRTSRRNGMPSARRHVTYPDGRLSYTGLDPVNAVTGSFLWSCTLLEDYGRDALQFTLMYDSQRDRHEASMGKGWTHALNYLLYQDAEYYYFSTPYDQVTAFLKEDGSSILLPEEDSGADCRLERKEDGSFSVKDPDGTEYCFDGELQLTEIRENGLSVCRFEAEGPGQTVRILGRHGGCISLTYADGHLSSAADALNNEVTFTYEGEFLASVTNPAGKQMSFTYDGEGRLAKIGDFSGNVYLENQYDSLGRTVSQTMADRGTSTVSYSEGCTSFTDEDGNVKNYYFNEAGNVTETELAGSSIRSSYNERGQMTEQIDALGNKTQMAYDDAGRMNLVTYPDLTTEQAFYNERNLPERIINRDGTESSYTYDERNNLLSVLDERGNTCSYAYDEQDNLTGFTDKEGNEWRYIYDENRHLCEALDPEGNRYLYVHDAIGRLTSYTTPTGRTTAYEYSAAGELLKIVDADGSQIFAYDGNGKCTGITDRMGNSQRLAYNAMGQVVLATDFLGKEYRFSYDARGNLLTETDPLGYQTEYGYDAFGNRVSRKDQNGGVTHFYFDADNRLTQVKDAAGGIVGYTYNNMGEVTAVTDPLSHQTTFAYDRRGRVISRTDALGHSVSYTYDQAGNILTATDEDGVVTTYGYDRESRLVSIETAAGTTTFTYDGLDRVISVLDTDGYTEQAQYDGDGNLILSADKESRRTGYAYDAMGRLVEETAPNGGKTKYAYDKNGNCTQITDPEEHVYTYAYDANNRLTKSTDPAGGSTAYEFDDRGQLVSVTDAKGGVTRYAYDGNGNRIRETNPVGGVKTYTYDSLNRLTGITDELGHTSTYVYDAAGNRITYTDANGNTWSYTYDANNRLTGITGQDEGSMTLTYSNTGRVLSITDAEGAETTYQYDALGRLTEMSDASGHSLSFGYDSVGHMVSQTDGNGNTTEFTYSPAGNLTGVTDGEGGTTSYTYNELGQVLTETDPIGNTVTYTYDLLGQVTSLTNALENTITFTYTADGRIEAVQDAEGAVTRYTYDACGNLSAAEDALGNIVRFEYDAMNNRIRECMDSSGEQTCITLYQYDKKGRRIKEILPLLEEKVYNYDGNDNMVSFTDEEGQETTVCYDLNNRPTSLAYSDGRTASFRYNLRGELVEMTDWNGTAAVERDVLGRLVKVTDHNGRETGFTYDGAGNRTGITYPDGTTAVYAYDRNNRLVKVTDGEGQAAQYTYDGAGNLLSIAQPGSTCTYTYNANRQPVKAAYSLGESVSMSETFTYDAMGRITGSERTGSMTEFARSAAYAYDAVGRLVSWQNGQNQEAYTYDALGNRTGKSVNGILKAAYQYNELNQLTAMTEDGVGYGFTYDRRGNLTQECRGDIPIRRYTYDTAGMMASGKNLESGEETLYAYNALRMRVGNTRKSGTGESLHTREVEYVPDFLGAAGNELMSYETGGAGIRHVFGRRYERLNRKLSGAPEGVPEKAYFQSDLYGSPLFATDAQGSLLQYAERGIWGDLKPGQEAVSGLEESLRFTSYSHDPVIGKYFAQARFYDSAGGRMLSMDPVKSGLNRYCYCNNDPVNHEDADGECLQAIAGFFSGAVLSFIFGFGGSVVSQLMDGHGVNWRQALGRGVNDGITGGIKMAAITSGVGLPMAVGLDFVAGTLGDAAERWITDDEFNPRKSITSGLTNAAGGIIYGNAPLKSAGSAFLRGLGSGAATSGINYISEALGSMGQTGAGAYPGMSGAIVSGALLPYTNGRDPRSGCGSSGMPWQGLGYSAARGYQYSTGQAENPQGRKREFGLGDFLKEVLIGGTTEGLSRAGSFGLDKVLGAVKRGIQGRNTEGIRNKIGNPVNPMDKSFEMALNPKLYANEVAKKYGINLKGSGQKVSILFNAGLTSAGKTRKINPNVIELGPSAFVSEEELANTIAHELNHARSFLHGGDAPEWGKGGAYSAGDALAEYIRGER